MNESNNFITKADLDILINTIKDKHKFDWIWKVLCFILLTTTIIFASLWFCNGNFNNTYEETEYHIETDGGDITETVIGENNQVYFRELRSEDAD